MSKSIKTSSPIRRDKDCWLSPCMRIVHDVDSPPFPRPSTSGDRTSILTLLTKFASICARTYGLVEDIAPAHLLLLQRIIGQYCQLVLQAAAQWASEESLLAKKKRACSNADGEALEKLQVEIKKVEALVPESQRWRGKWMSLTIFDVFYAALASRYGAGDEQDRSLRARIQDDSGKTHLIIEWVEDAFRFLPMVVVFDGPSHLVSMSCAKWDGNKMMAKWETGLRTARIAPEVRCHLTFIDSLLDSVVENAAISSEQQVIEANALLSARLSEDEDLCKRLCAGHTWSAIKTSDFGSIDPCALCQVFYHHSTPSPPVTLPPHKRLRGNRLKEEPLAWQCAESCLISQLWDMRIGKSLAREVDRRLSLHMNSVWCRARLTAGDMRLVACA